VFPLSKKYKNSIPYSESICYNILKIIGSENALANDEGG
jgi:hypothetical protein